MISIKKRAATAVPNPAADKVTLFIDDTGAPKTKNSAGTVTAVGGGGGASIITQAAPPSSPAEGDLWIDSDEPATQGGGSAVGPDTAPATANAADYEFGATSTTLPTGWSWVNQGTATYSEALGAGVLDLLAGGSDESRSLVRAIPGAASFTLIVKFHNVSIGAIGVFPSRHVILRESATDKQMRFTIVSSAGNGGTLPECVADYYSNGTTFGTRLGASVVLLNHYAGDANYVKVTKNSATSWDWSLSMDGIAWVPIHAGLNVGGSLTPDQIGVGANMRARRTIVGVHHFRVT